MPETDPNPARALKKLFQKLASPVPAPLLYARLRRWRVVGVDAGKHLHRRIVDQVHLAAIGASHAIPAERGRVELFKAPKSQASPHGFAGFRANHHRVQHHRSFERPGAGPPFALARRAYTSASKCRARVAKSRTSKPPLAADDTAIKTGLYGVANVCV